AQPGQLDFVEARDHRSENEAEEPSGGENGADRIRDYQQKNEDRPEGAGDARTMRQRVRKNSGEEVGEEEQDREATEVRDVWLGRSHADAGGPERENRPDHVSSRTGRGTSPNPEKQERQESVHL